MSAKSHVYMIPLLSTIAGLGYLYWRQKKNPALGSQKTPMLATALVGSAATIFLLHQYHQGFRTVLQDFHLQSAPHTPLATNSLVVAPDAPEMAGQIG